MHSSYSNMTPILLTCCTLVENGSCFGLLSVLARNGRSLSEFLFLKASQKSKIVIFFLSMFIHISNLSRNFGKVLQMIEPLLTRGDTKKKHVSDKEHFIIAA